MTQTTSTTVTLNAESAAGLADQLVGELQAGQRKPINLETLLEVAKRGQWSVHDFDWSTPVQDRIAWSSRKKKLLGRMLLMTAGFERLGVDAFMIHAKHTDDKVAKTIFQLIALDEQRHADAEVELAKRLGVIWGDLPSPVRLMFKRFGQDIRSASRKPISRLLHEFAASGVPVAELALDTLLLPALKKMSDDSLLMEVFKLIDRDEARHIAMDYWLLEEKARIQQQDKTPGNMKKGGEKIPFRLSSIVAAAVGLIVFSWSVRDSALAGEDFKAYWDRLLKVPDKAPHSMEVKSFRNTVRFLESSVDFFARRPLLFKSALFAATGRTR